MLELMAFLFIAVAYFAYGRSHGFNKSELGALAFAALHLLIYLGVPPHTPIKSTYSGQLFGLLPMFALALILFPEINPKAPSSMATLIGWLMLLSISGTLAGFKLFVW